MKYSLKYNSKEQIRLDQYLKLKMDDFSRTKIQKLIKAGKITVDDFIVKPSFILKCNSLINISDNLPDSNSKIIPEKMDIQILYEDEDIIAINKESGIVVHPGINNHTGTLLNGLMYHYKSLSNINANRPGIIHRLDKETSGVILIAKNDFSHYFISEQFANRKIKKKYKSLVWGNINESGSIEGLISRNPKNRLAFHLNQNQGKYSKTTYNRVYKGELPIALLDLFPTTGRTHQIRVHLSSVHHPILNDYLYYEKRFSTNGFNQKYIKDIDYIIKKMSRVALHAYEIEFVHPKTKKIIKIKAPLAKDIEITLLTLKEKNEKY